MQAAHVIAARRGFTLIEMVFVILILGVIGTSFGVFVVPAVRASRAIEQRAALIDSAELALRRMTRDIRIALPNSVRVSSIPGTGFAVEMIPTIDGGRFCVSGEANCSGANQLLAIGSPDTDFDIVGCFRNPAFIGAAFPSTAFRLVIGDSAGTVYTAAGASAVLTAAGTGITLTTVNGGGAGSGACGASSGVGPPATSYRHHINLSVAQTFPQPSGRRRVYVIDRPVTYICNIAAGTLIRYYSYPIASVAPTPTSPPASATSALVTDKISDCSVATSTATVQANGFVKLSISLANSGEAVQLVSEAQLDNSI
jgi:MSHA biogenesis protein MshO